MKVPEHFKEGIRFECQGSGKCCVSHGEFGFVYMTLEDRKRMAKSLNLKLSQFTKDYCQPVEGLWALKDNPKGPECLFLENNKCSVYLGRPTQCRTWPFWPEVLNARSWKKNVESFCPGVGKGKLYTHKQMEAAANEQAASELALWEEKSKTTNKN